MNRTEIERQLYSGSVVIDIQEIEDAPGFIRVITIHSIPDGFRVSLEYDWIKNYLEKNSEGGILVYKGSYENLDATILSLEKFLNRSISEWTNFSSRSWVPKLNFYLDYKRSKSFFERQVVANNIPLPLMGVYELKSEHFKHLVLYGEFRQDKVYEVQGEQCIIKPKI